MPTVIFIDHGGSRTEIEAPVGRSIRDSAMAAGIVGILGDCGGFANCGTCHVYVDPAWLAHLAPVSDIEAGMLQGAACEALSNSRLSCQLPMTEALDGIVLRLPESQI
jgi:2Fe-2S ferredoxin